MSNLERITRNAGKITGFLGLGVLSYVGVLKFAEMKRDDYGLEALRDTFLCYKIKGIDHHECWSNEAAKKKDFYQNIYDTLTFGNSE